MAGYGSREQAQVVRVAEEGKLEGESYGECSWKLYEVCPPGWQNEEACLFVWLHGQDNVHLDSHDMQTMQRRIGRRLFCLVPRNPELYGGSKRFLWGLGYTRVQNRGGLGFVFGELDIGFLDAMCGLVQESSQATGAKQVVICGYSMGGFGAYQLGSHSPTLFDVVISVAGHGKGTLERQENGYGAPQPESSRIFQHFLVEHAPKLAAVPKVIAIHARRDCVSLFTDTEAIIDAIRAHSGNAEVVVVPDDMADSDVSGRRKSSQGHSYYYYSLLKDSSEEILYSKLRPLLGNVLQPALATEAALPLPSTAGPDESDLQAIAAERLQLNRSDTSIQLIDGLKDTHGLSDETELALRMLDGVLLAELVRHVPSELAAAELTGETDANTVIRGLIAEIDPEADSLVQRLTRHQQEQELQDDLEEARARRDAHRSDQELAALVRLKKSCGFGKKVDLALRMLVPEHLTEILGGEQDVIAKSAEVEDVEKFMLWLVSQLDTRVEALAERLLAAEGEVNGATAPDRVGKRRLPAALPMPIDSSYSQESQQTAVFQGGGTNWNTDGEARATKVARRVVPPPPPPPEDLPQQEPKTEAPRRALPTPPRHPPAIAQLPRPSAPKHPPPPASARHQPSQPNHPPPPSIARQQPSQVSQAATRRVVPPPPPPEAAMAEVERRLMEHKTHAATEAIQGFKAQCDFGDEAELALRLMRPVDLWKLLARKDQLLEELATVQDRGCHVRNLVAQLDPAAEALVRKVSEIADEDR